MLWLYISILYVNSVVAMHYSDLLHMVYTSQTLVYSPTPSHHTLEQKVESYRASKFLCGIYIHMTISCLGPCLLSPSSFIVTQPSIQYRGMLYGMA